MWAAIRNLFAAYQSTGWLPAWLSLDVNREGKWNSWTQSRNLCWPARAAIAIHKIWNLNFLFFGTKLGSSALSGELLPVAGRVSWPRDSWSLQQQQLYTWATLQAKWGALCSVALGRKSAHVVSGFSFLTIFFFASFLGTHTRAANVIN